MCVCCVCVCLCVCVCVCVCVSELVCACVYVYTSAIVLTLEQMVIITSINNFFPYYSNEDQLYKYSQKLFIAIAKSQKVNIKEEFKNHDFKK